MCVVGALECARPLSAPLCKFLTLHSLGTGRRIPLYVTCIVRYLVLQVEGTRHHSRASRTLSSATCPRFDMQVSWTRRGVGGWFQSWISVVFRIGNPLEMAVDFLQD